MTILNRKLWAGLLVLLAVALVSSAAAVGGIEWALASLGAMVLIGMIGISIYVLIKVLRYSNKSLKGGRLEYNSTSAVFCDGDDFKCVTCNEPVEGAPISKEDKRLIMQHIDELFTKDLEQSQERPAEGAPISKEDKRLIMQHIDELLIKEPEQSQEKPAEGSQYPT